MQILTIFLNSFLFFQQQRSDDQELENRNDSKKTVQLEVPVDLNGHNRSSSPKRGYQMPRVHSSRNISRHSDLFLKISFGKKQF